MNHHRVVQVIEELLPQIKQAGSPQSVMLKYAQDQNLSPAQLEKMGQVFNTAKTLTFLDRAPDRGSSFDLLDVPAMVEEFSAWAPTAKAASAAAPQYNALRFPGLPPMRPADPEMFQTKAASTIEQLSVWEKRVRKQAVTGLVQKLEDAEEEWSEKQAAARKWARQQDAMADVSLQESAADILYHLGAWGKTACEWVWGQVPAVEDLHEKRAFDTSIANSEPRKEALDWAITLVEGAQTVAGLRTKLASMSDIFLKAMFDGDYAKKIEGHTPSRSVGTYTADDQNPDEDRAWRDSDADIKNKEQDALLSNLEAAFSTSDKPPPRPVVQPTGYTPDEMSVTGLSSGIDKHVTAPLGNLSKNMNPLALIKGMSDNVNTPSRVNKGQQTVDSARIDTERSLVLARLMQSDPIISEADPDTVQDIFNSLQEASPEFVRDPSRLRMALREAVEYGAVPIHTLNEILNFRKTMAESRVRESDLEEKAYRI